MFPFIKMFISGFKILLTTDAQLKLKSNTHLSRGSPRKRDRDRCFGVQYAQLVCGYVGMDWITDYIQTATFSGLLPHPPSYTGSGIGVPTAPTPGALPNRPLVYQQCDPETKEPCRNQQFRSGTPCLPYLPSPQGPCVRPVHTVLYLQQYAQRQVRMDRPQ